jgi:hypothetical protein
MPRLCGVVLGVLLVGAAASSTAAERPWVEAKSAHFTVISDAGEKTAREVVWQFEQIRAAILVVWPWVHPDLDKPVLVFAAHDETSMKTLAPRYWEQGNGVRPTSVFATGADRYYIALRTDTNPEDKDGINPYSGAYWSYAALVLETGLTHNMPLWFSRGLADVMSNTIVRDTSIQIGRPIPWHLRRLQSGQRLLLSDLLAVDASSPWYRDPVRLPTLDAQCWGLMHYLMFGDEGAHRQALNRFVTLLLEGKSPTVAFELSIGSLAALERGLATYITRPTWLYERIAVDLGIKREAFAVKTLPPAESAATRAALHITLGRPSEARALVADAQKLEPSVAGSYEAEGRLLEADRQLPEARAAYKKAMELGSTSYYPHYRWAVLSRGADSGADGLSQIEQALSRSASLNSYFAPTYALLAEVKAEQGQADALGLAKRAVALEPRQLRHRLSLALVLWRLSRVDEATTEAKGALALADGEAERNAAQQLLDFFGRSVLANRRTQ